MKWDANSRNRDAMPLWPLLGRLELPLTRLAAFDAAALRSWAAIISTMAMISSVGSTQSIGIELHRSVGQLSRSGPSVPPATWICRPVMILPQTKQ